MAHPTSACQIISSESSVTWHSMIFANDIPLQRVSHGQINALLLFMRFDGGFETGNWYIFAVDCSASRMYGVFYFSLFESLSESDTSFKSRFARSRELEWTQLRLLCPASTCANRVSVFWSHFERMIQWAFVTATSQHNLSICQSMLLRDCD